MASYFGKSPLYDGHCPSPDDVLIRHNRTVSIACLSEGPIKLLAVRLISNLGSVGGVSVASTFECCGLYLYG